jgi:hypothetical protein
MPRLMAASLNFQELFTANLGSSPKKFSPKRPAALKQTKSSECLRPVEQNGTCYYPFFIPVKPLAAGVSF